MTDRTSFLILLINEILLPLLSTKVSLEASPLTASMSSQSFTFDPDFFANGELKPTSSWQLSWSEGIPGKRPNFNWFLSNGGLRTVLTYDNSGY